MLSLRNSLSKTDPDRTLLTLRLADLYFDVSIQESSDHNITKNRNEALRLYGDVLYGRDHLEKPSPDKAVIIKFQIARVLNKLQRADEAKKYYLDVFSSEKVEKKIKRESSFSLAEYYEEKINFNLADKYYVNAIGLCESIESCNYAHYKRAWLHYKDVKLPTAIKELKLSLFERDGSVREKVLNDLLLFFSAQMTDGEHELSYIEQLEQKLNRNDLVKKLVEAFYSAGNRLAGIKILMALNERSPDVFYEARLIEEYFGYKDFDLMTKYLNKLSLRKKEDIPKLDAETIEFKAMLKRILVQFDSQAQSDKKYGKSLQALIDQYLIFYPDDEMREKLQQGWLKVEDDLTKKIDRLALWIKQDTDLGIVESHIIKLRESRLSFAIQSKLADIIIEEAFALSQMKLTNEKKREYKYIYAHQLYKNKQFDLAIAVFSELAKIDINGIDKINLDKWAIQSQHLLLDIYNIRKDYSSMISQASLWLDDARLKDLKSIKSDLSSIQLIKNQALFENAVKLGETNQALSKFYQYCFEKLFENKSCENAKILAYKLKDQEKIVSLLEKAKDEKSLMYQYEAMGEFSKAAILFEKHTLGKHANTLDYLKVSLFYELAGTISERDRILSQMVEVIRKKKRFEQNTENAIYTTLEQANMLDNKTLLLPWSLSNKLNLAAKLSVLKPSVENLKIIQDQKQYTGSTWAKFVLNKVQEAFSKQKKIVFYGQNSKNLFKKRLNGLNQAVNLAKSYLDGANTQMRIYLLDMLKKSYNELATEILETPLPEGLTEEVLTQVKVSLSELAKPYQEMHSEYSNLQLSQIDSLADDSIGKSNRISEISRKNIEYATLITDDVFLDNTSPPLNYIDFRKQLNALKTNPYSKNHLSMIEKYLNDNKQSRLASYFTGRIMNIKETNRE